MRVSDKDLEHIGQLALPLHTIPNGPYGITVRDLVRSLQDERAANAEKDKRIAELKDECESNKEASEEFGGDCWKALRFLLDLCDWDWNDSPSATVDEAREHIADHITELEWELVWAQVKK